MELGALVIRSTRPGPRSSWGRELAWCGENQAEDDEKFACLSQFLGRFVCLASLVRLGYLDV